MQLKRKTLLRSEWSAIARRDVRVRRLDTPAFRGAACLFTIGKMAAPFAVEGTVLADEGYRWLQLAPCSAHWWLTAMFDPSGAPVGHYFDITLFNDFSDPCDPAFFDLFVDVAVTAAGAVLLDCDELDAALSAGVISPAQHALALAEGQRILRACRAHPDAQAARLAALCRRMEREGAFSD